MAGERKEDYKGPVDGLLISGHQIMSGRNWAGVVTRFHLGDKETEKGASSLDESRAISSELGMRPLVERISGREILRA